MIPSKFVNQIQVVHFKVFKAQIFINLYLLTNFFNSIKKYIVLKFYNFKNLY